MIVPEKIMKYFQGNGLELSEEFEPVYIPNVTIDLYNTYTKCPQQLKDVNQNYDFIFADKALSKVKSFNWALKRWLTVLKNGGYLILRCIDTIQSDPNIVCSLKFSDTFSFSVKESKSLSHFSIKELYSDFKKEDLNLICYDIEEDIEQEGRIKYLWIVARKKMKIFKFLDLLEKNNV